ncbi:uncharacterized protein LOC133733247 [Rosa rugosa]|uniref:uncharacterized protein LOC133733247 n=1 Tax=Rosa rugosa TaxID=74645 RepID=UPI002B40D934|nr:uncharacterized protein LOC133733247 [Rosa rugosa]
MSGEGYTTGTHASIMSFGEAYDGIHQLKRCKRLPARASSKFTDTSIDDLPDYLLVEVLCRLPDNKICLQCTSVCRRWCSLISDPHFIGRFLWLQRDLGSPIIRTLINHNAEEFPTKDVFQRLRSFLRLKEDPFVLATWNDLVLCCASKDDQHDYYICNPYTMQLVTLPPIPACHKFVPVGFICEPYYNYEEEDGDHRKEQKININGDYRCKVVRIVPSEITCFGITIQVFSSETGEWRESVVSTPGDLSSIVKENFTFDFLGVYQGFLRMCDYNFDNYWLLVWEMTEEEHEQLVVIGPGKCGLEHVKRYSLPPKMIPGDPDGHVELLTFDPNNGDILYLRINGEIVKCNIRTGKWSKMVGTNMLTDLYFFQLVLPWWPTPVPRLPDY